VNAWLPCAYAVGLIGVGMLVAGAAGYWLGRYREQLALLEQFPSKFSMRGASVHRPLR
jgi:hypothetical protein